MAGNRQNPVSTHRSDGQIVHAPERLDFIDALRGLAAAYVVLFHIVWMPNPNLALPNWLTPIVLNGGTGVMLFFLLSAYTMCHTMRARAGADRSGTTFYLRRFFRIAPLYYVMFAVLLATAYRRGATPPSAGESLASLTFTFNLIPAWHHGVVWAGWTIGVEVLFYVAFPFIFRFVTSTGRAWGFVGLACVIAFVHDALLARWLPAEYDLASVRDIGFFHQLPIFAVGMLLYYVDQAWRQAGGRRHFAGIGLLLAGMIGWMILPSLVAGVRTLAFFYGMTAVYAAIVLGLSACPLRGVVNRGTRFLGTISYSLYLVHPLLVVVASRRVYSHLYPPGEASALRWAACCAVTFAVLVPLAYASYRLIEQPGMWLGSAVIRRRATRRRPSATTPVPATLAPPPLAT